MLDLQDDSGLLCHGNNDLPTPPLAYVLSGPHSDNSLVPLLIKLGFIEMMGRSTSSSHASFVLLQNYSSKGTRKEEVIHWYTISSALSDFVSFFLSGQLNNCINVCMGLHLFLFFIVGFCQWFGR